MTGPVLVIGPRRAGATSLVERLRERLPATVFVEADDLAEARPAAVVFVVSAAAPITESDCAIAQSATRSTDAVIAVITKIDDHRQWRSVLALGRVRLAGHVPRLRAVPWVGAAAAPRLGEPRVEDVVATLIGMLADPGTAHRNRLRRWESALSEAIVLLESPSPAGSALRRRRVALAVERHRGPSERVLTLRGRLQRVRVELGAHARDRCGSARTALLDEISQHTRHTRVELVEDRAASRCRELIDEFDDLAATRIREVAEDVGLAPVAVPPPVPPPAVDPLRRPRRLESRLTVVLGAGFGVGAGLVIARACVGLAPDSGLPATVLGLLAGLLLTSWVVRARRVLHDRAALERWVTDATVVSRRMIEDRIATLVLAAEAALVTSLWEAADAQRAVAADRMAACEAELRALDRAATRAAALNARCATSLRTARDAVRAGLRTAEPADSRVTDR